MAKQTAGERNNNPGNLRVSTSKWIGKYPPEPGQTFERFVDPVKGIRAMAVLLMNYQDKYGLRTVASMIAKYAPGHENPTDAYVHYVASAMRIGPNDPFDFHDYGYALAMVDAMIHFENGRNNFRHLTPQALRQAGITAPVKPLATSKTIVGTGSTATGVGLEQAADPLGNTLAPLLTDSGNQLAMAAELSTWIKALAGVLLVGGIVLTIYGRFDVRARTGE